MDALPKGLRGWPNQGTGNGSSSCPSEELLSPGHVGSHTPICKCPQQGCPRPHPTRSLHSVLREVSTGRPEKARRSPTVSRRFPPWCSLAAGLTGLAERTSEGQGCGRLFHWRHQLADLVTLALTGGCFPEPAQGERQEPQRPPAPGHSTRSGSSLGWLKWHHPPQSAATGMVCWHGDTLPQVRGPRPTVLWPRLCRP